MSLVTGGEATYPNKPADACVLEISIITSATAWYDTCMASLSNPTALCWIVKTCESACPAEGCRHTSGL